MLQIGLQMNGIFFSVKGILPMLVSDVKNFIQKCIEYDKGQTNDDQIISLGNAFVNKQDTEELTQADYDVIIKFFKDRFVPNSSTDYTQDSSSSVNKACIEFSKIFAPLINKTYLNVLFPDVTNDLDPCDSSKLDQVLDPIFLFLDEKNSTLYSKDSYKKYLEKHGFLLSVPIQNSADANQSTSSADLVSKKLPSTMSISLNVLSRIRASKLAEGSIENHHHNLWDYIKSQCLANSKIYDCPDNLFISLSKLIDSYFNLKNSGESFSKFEEQFAIFKKTLYASTPLDYTNFCGAWIGKKDNKEYLIDYLFEVDLAKNYTLDADLEILSTWIYEFEPSFIHSEATKSNHAEKLADLRECTSCNDIHPLYKLLLRLFTTSFPKESPKYCLWDIEKNIDQNIINLFDKLALNRVIESNTLNEIESNTLNEIDNLYEKIKTARFNIVINGLSGPDFFSSQSSSPITLSWEDYLNQNSSIKCLYPEVLLIACVKFKPKDNQVTQKIHAFIDQLIRTYCDDKNSDLVVLRVNYLYLSLLQELKLLGKTDGVSLNSYISLYRYKDSKAGFLDTTKNYIFDRLLEKGALTSNDSTSLKMQMLHSNRLSADRAPENLTTVLAHFSNQLTTYVNIKPSMTTYLFSLKAPILSKENVNTINNASTDNSAGVGVPFQ